MEKKNIIWSVLTILAIILLLLYVSSMEHRTKQHINIIKPECDGLCKMLNCSYAKAYTDAMMLIHSQKAENGDQCNLVFCTDNNCWNLILYPEKK